MAAAISRECVIDRSIGPAWTRSANAAVRPDDLEQADVTPDGIVSSIAQLPDWLEQNL